jgi:carboxyl-terminal processing protease
MKFRPLLATTALFATMTLLSPAPAVAESSATKPQPQRAATDQKAKDANKVAASKTADPKAAAPKTEERLPLTDLRVFTEVFHQIREAYVEEVDDRTLLENAIKGMLAGLDPHSAYLDERSFGDLRVSTSGEFGGVGLEVGAEDGFVKVITAIDETPAQKAGIEAGDLIIKLDNQPIKGMNLNDAVKMMRGERGSKVTLTILREGVSQPFDITLTRDVIHVASVRSKALEPGYGYVRIAQFQNNTGEDFRKAIDKLKRDNNGQLKGIVMDLRNNPGGVLQASVEVVDALVESGLIVYTKGRLPNSDTSFNASPGDIMKGAPVVVLINGGSASASEIVAGALQDHKRAIIVGTQSFGKGSVQTVLPLPEDRAIKLTTALYFTPKGRSIQAEGIVPDIAVERAKLTKLKDIGGIKEADLTGHLDNANETAAQKKAKEKAEDLQEQDNQLYEALNLLKGIHLLTESGAIKAAKT